MAQIRTFSQDMKGTTCLVTGATNGIGLATAQALAHLGARVIVLGRDTARCQATRAGLIDINPDAGHECMTCDFGSLDQVRNVAEAYRERGWPLDVLVNNAGALFTRRVETEDGIESTLAVNHVAPFLLTLELLDRMHESAGARIVNVASNAHSGVKHFEFDDLGLERKYGVWNAYARSKLANILFTRALARRIADTSTTVNAMHPGAVSTGLGGRSGLGKWIWLILGPFFRSPPKGAETVVYLSVSPEVSGQSGGYYMDCAPIAPKPAAIDDEAAERLWSLSEKLSGKRFAAAP